MDTALLLLDWIGRVSTVIVICSLVLALYAWFRGILPVLYRLGKGLVDRRVAICARGDALRSLENLLIDSGLFKKQNLIDVPDPKDLGRVEKASIILVFWKDWRDHLDDVLRAKRDSTALVVYAPQEDGRIPPEQMKRLDGQRNTIVTNFRGRLLNDLVTSLITTRV
jgi:hypothetical protein